MPGLDAAFSGPYMFQSLFWWNVLLNYFRRRRSWRYYLRFQSLFWWNVLLNFPWRSPLMLWRRRFNPCSGGMYFWIISSVFIKTWIWCFNPCSGGMYFWIQALELLPRLELRFNPCSGGMYFWIMPDRRWRCCCTQFQSLFWWNVLLNYGFGYWRVYRFTVSILVLVECTSELPPRESPLQALPGFNPCSGGMYFWITDRWRQRTVLGCFNPCSGGMYFWIHTPAPHGYWIKAVSILVLVECTSEYKQNLVLGCF